MKGEDNELHPWTGNNTFVVNIVLEVEVEIDGDFICKALSILPYLKKFGEEVTVEIGDFMTFHQEPVWLNPKSSRMVQYAGLLALVLDFRNAGCSRP